MNLSTRTHRIVGAVAIGAFSLGVAACGSDSPAPASVADTGVVTTVPDDAMTEDSITEDSITDEAITDDATAELPAWQTMTITDIDGATFTLDDFRGRPVLVETFATWCPNCRSQLTTTNALAESVGDAAAVIALSVETDLSPADVRRYVDDNGFDAVRFAVVTPELLAALVDGFGQSIANPPSTPKFVIDPMGQASDLTTGSENADELSTRLGLAG